MCRSLLRVVVPFAVTIGVLVGAPAAPVPKHLMTPLPPYLPATTGTVWVYELSETVDLVWTVNKVRQKGDAFYIDVISQRSDEANSRCLHQYAVSTRGICTAARGDAESDDYLLKLPIPREKSTKWEHSVVEDGVRWDTRRVADGPVEVEVPAGTYQAIRVETEMCQDDEVCHTDTKWYTRGVGIVKMRFRGGELNLKSYTPGKN